MYKEVFKLFFLISFFLLPSYSLAIDDTFKINLLVGADTESPTKPTNLTATPISIDQIDLAWTASGDNVAVDGYQVWRDSVQIATTSAISYSDTGLSASTLYDYYIVAFDATYNFSSSSDNVSTTTLSVQATPTTPVVAATDGSSATKVGGRYNVSDLTIIPGKRDLKINFDTSDPMRVDLRWGRTLDYELGYSQFSALKKEHSLSIPNLEPNTKYLLSITLRDRFGRIVDTYEISTKTLPDVDVIAPNNVSNLVGKFLNDSINLTWRNPKDSDFDYVRIVRSEQFFPLDESDGLVIYEGSAEKFKDTNISLERHYYYTVFAYDKNNNRSSGAAVYLFSGENGEGISLPPTTEEIEIPLPDGFGFNLIQGDFQQSSAEDENLRILQSEPTLFSIPYDSLPEHLKTIIVTLTKKETAETFSFLLRINAKRSAYEAMLDSFADSGDYTYNVIVYDYKLRHGSIAEGELVVVPDSNNKNMADKDFVFKLFHYFWIPPVFIILYLLIRRIWW